MDPRLAGAGLSVCLSVCFCSTMCGCSPSRPPGRLHRHPRPPGRPGPRHVSRGAVAAPRLRRRVRLGEADLDRAEKSPTCAAYTEFPLRTAATAEFTEVLAALLPCMWGYAELGRALAATGLPAEFRYRRWIQTYADPEFAALAAWCAALLDRAADGLPSARLAACERAFLTSLRHELAFWDA
jgi:thiaminase